MPKVYGPYGFGQRIGQKFTGSIRTDYINGANPPPSTLPAESRWRTLAAVTLPPDEPPVPVVLSCQSGNVERSGIYDTDVPSLVSPAFGVATSDWSGSQTVQGALRVTYSAWGEQRQRLVDMRSGSFQLPPCHSVKVEGQFYNQTLGANNIVRVTDVAIAPGVIPSPSIATMSGIRAVTVGTQFFALPAGCEGWRVGSWATLLPVDVQLWIRGGQPEVYVDYNVPLYTPGVPDLASQFGNLGIDKAGAGAMDLVVSALIAF